LVAIDKVCWYFLQLNWHVDYSHVKLIRRLAFLYLPYSASADLCQMPQRWQVESSQGEAVKIYAAGGVGGFTTMVVVFVVCLWCVLCLVWSLSLVVCKKVREDNPKVGLWV
jgi:hypothetical protein